MSPLDVVRYLANWDIFVVLRPQIAKGVCIRYQSRKSYCIVRRKGYDAPFRLNHWDALRSDRFEDRRHRCQRASKCWPCLALSALLPHVVVKTKTLSLLIRSRFLRSRYTQVNSSNILGRAERPALIPPFRGQQGGSVC